MAGIYDDLTCDELRAELVTLRATYQANRDGRRPIQIGDQSTGMTAFPTGDLKAIYRDLCDVQDLIRTKCDCLRSRRRAVGIVHGS